jgi:hypothetical protein
VGELQRSALAYQPHISIDIPPSSGTAPADTGKETAADLGAARSGAFPGQIGHGTATTTRGSSLGFFGSLATPPVTGPSILPVANGLMFPYASPLGVPGMTQNVGAVGQPIPAMGFPRIDGENPRLWKTLCEQYFPYVLY